MAGIDKQSHGLMGDLAEMPRVFAQFDRLAGRSFSFALPGGAIFVLTLNAFSEAFHAAWLGTCLAVLLVLHVIRYPRLSVVPETKLCLAFTGYMAIQLLWTRDVALAMNTLVPALAYVLTMLLYTAVFNIPDEFSYNAIASIYLFRLLSMLLLGSYVRLRVALVIAAFVLSLMVVATTSIKTSLGIILGVMTAAVVQFRFFARILRRYVILIAAIVVGVGYATFSSPQAMNMLERGMTRVLIGIQVLEAREDQVGYSAFAEREEWREEGIRGWTVNPVFGYGPEAFRDRFGVTSHSTPIDALYNSGLIGLLLFYGLFPSLMWRVLCAPRTLTDLKALLTGGLACYLFVSLSGALSTNAYLAAFVATGVALLDRHGREDPLTSESHA